MLYLIFTNSWVDFAVGAEPARHPGEAPREGVSSKNGWGWGGRNARDRCAGTGGWVGISESVCMYVCMYVCAPKMVKNPNCHFGFENLVGGKAS